MIHHYFSLLNSLLNERDRILVFYVILLISVVSLLEVSMVLTIGIFISLISSGGELNVLFLSDIFNDNVNVLILAFTTYWALCSVSSILMTYYINFTVFKIGAGISTSLYTFYSSQNLDFHYRRSSDQLITNVVAECNRLTSGVLMPIFNLAARLVLVFFMCVALFIYNPAITSIIVVAVLMIYITIFFLTKPALQRNSDQMAISNSDRMGLVQDTFSSIRNILLLNSVSSLLSRYSAISDKLGESQASNSTISSAPRYAVELLVFSGISVGGFVVLNSENSDFITLELVAVFGIAAMKLLPAAQQLFNYIATIKGNLSALDLLATDVGNSRSGINSDKAIQSDVMVHTSQNVIEMRNVSYNYPSVSQRSLNIDKLTIAKGAMVGVVGPSGSGKSTFIDLVAGLITPTSGTVFNSALNASSNGIAYVPQDIALFNGTIPQNVAFTSDESTIDTDYVKSLLDQVALPELSSLVGGSINTRLGNGANAIQLSGGQRQRLGLARALYSNSELLLLDEFTSALDEHNEGILLEVVNRLKGQKTLIMVTHRIHTLSHCDYILHFNNGKPKKCFSIDDVGINT